MTQPLPQPLVDYLTARDNQRVQAVADALGALSDRERALVREAAVMGYVQGRMHPQGEPHPPNSAVLFEVIDACLAMPDLYPAFAALGANSDDTREEDASTREETPQSESDATT